MIKLPLNLVERQVDKEKRTIKVRGTTNSKDRSGDTIQVSGWELDNFLKNPVIPWSHRTSEPPVAKALSVERLQNGLDFVLEFPTRELFPFGDFIFRMMAAGFINATSVGFLPKEREIILDSEGKFTGINFKRQELLELSIVTVPDNPEALTLDFEKAIKENITTAEELKQYEKEFEFTIGKCPEYKRLAEELIKEHKLLQKGNSVQYTSQEEKEMKEKIEALEKQMSELKDKMDQLASFKEMTETSNKLMDTINESMKALMSGAGSNPIKTLLASRGQNSQNGGKPVDVSQITSMLTEMTAKLKNLNTQK